MVCEGCGQPALMPMAGPACFVCENRAAIPDVVHTLRPPPRTSASVFPCSEVKTGSENPFIKYRALSWVYAQCREQGFSDADYCPGPPGDGSAPFAFATVNRLSMVLLYGRARHLPALFGVIRPG